MQPAPKTVLAMVGLPARGKSFFARKIARYFNWRGHPTRIFNVGAYRRAHLGARKDYTFFDPHNADARAARMQVAKMALEELLEWLMRGGQVGIFDATNTTEDRRAMIRERCHAAGVALTFVETVCDDPETIERNIRGTKLLLPDYAGVDADEAVHDFRARIDQYLRSYATLSDESQSWIKLTVLEGGARRVIVNRVESDLAVRAAKLLVGFQSSQSTIWLTRHGESVFNREGRIGGDAPLSERGVAFAERLSAWLAQRLVDTDSRPPVVWTSTLERTRQTAERLGLPSESWRALDEIDAGICDGMTYGEIEEKLPAEWAARNADKLRYRYPRGESYLDVIARLDPLIADLERTREPLLIVGHQAVLRALYAYLAERPREDCPFIDIPLHTVIELAPGGVRPREERFVIEPRRPDSRARS